MTGNHDNNILSHYGGLENSSLKHTLTLPEDENDENSHINLIGHSPYLDNEQTIKFLCDNSTNFNVLSTNIESVRAKFDEISIYLNLLRESNVEFDAICLQECWISDDTDLALIHLDGYNLIAQGKSCSNKGGLMIYLRDHYTYKELKFDYSTTRWEGQFIETSINNSARKILIGNIYRPPRNLNDNYSNFTNELSSILSEMENQNSDAIICGDFNINLLKINEKETIGDVFEMMCSKSFFPKITLPTRFSLRNGTLIDNIFCKISDTTLNTPSGILIKTFSDHHPYISTFKIPNIKEKYIKYIRVNEHKDDMLINISNDLENIRIIDKLYVGPFANPNINYNTLEDILSNTFKKYSSFKIVKFRKYKHRKSSWITKGIIKSIQFRDNLHKQLKQLDINSLEYSRTKDNLKVYNAILRKNIRAAKKLHYSKLFDKYKNDIRNTWSTINKILGKNNNSKKYNECININGEQVKDKNIIAQHFNDYFINIGKNLTENIIIPDTGQFKDYMNNTISSKLTFHEVTELEIDNIFNSLTSKPSSGYDNISTRQLKKLKSYLLSPITIIINQMLNTGYFPDNLKIAKVIPIFRKDDPSLCNNYRPISLLPAISKIFEKVIFKQLYDYFTDNNLFYQHQYGFRSGHSTEMAVLETIDRISAEMDNYKTPLNIYLDLSKAFDTINHSILLEKLNYYGVSGMANILIKSYLTSRKQYVNFQEAKSALLEITTGIPQGSILGPLLFIIYIYIYINDISSVSSLFVPITYADDTTLSSNLNTFLYANNETPENEIDKELDKISNWLKLNKLSLNIKKN